MSGFRIKSLCAWVMIDPVDDDESVPATLGPGNTWCPLVGGDEARLRSLRPHAETIAREMGRSIRLIRFSVREELEVIEPKPKE